MKLARQPRPWKCIKHCQRNATRHGAYSAQVYSARAYLRALDALLVRLETQPVPDNASLKFAKGVAVIELPNCRQDFALQVACSNALS